MDDVTVVQADDLAGVFVDVGVPPVLEKLCLLRDGVAYIVQQVWLHVPV